VPALPAFPCGSFFSTLIQKEAAWIKSLNYVYDSLQIVSFSAGIGASRQKRVFLQWNFNQLSLNQRREYVSKDYGSIGWIGTGRVCAAARGDLYFGMPGEHLGICPGN